MEDRALTETAPLPKIPPKHLKDGCYARADALEAHLNAAREEIERLRTEVKRLEEKCEGCLDCNPPEHPPEGPCEEWPLLYDE
jgi:hypothetical protein